MSDVPLKEYMESRIAAYRAAFGNTPLVGYIVDEPPSGAQPQQTEGPAGILDHGTAHDLRLGLRHVKRRASELGLNHENRD